MKRSSIGGQGVLEGVMMRSPKYTGIAVRKESGEMVISKKENHPLTEKYKFFGVPIIRGVVNFVEMLFSGVKTITDSAKMYDEQAEEEITPSKMDEFIAKKTGKDSMDVAMAFSVVLALVIAIGLFFLLPNFLTGLIGENLDHSILKNLIDGLVRLGIFFAYVAIISNLKDIKRLFGYHGAEHKVINCYEHEMPMDVEHAQKCSTRHPRCGTSFLLIVMAISIFCFCFLGWNENPALRMLSRIAMLPVVAGVSYEVLKLLAKYENGITRILRKPGMALQGFTTREPEDGMVEAALMAFFVAENEMTSEQIEAKRKEFSHVKEEKKEDADTETAESESI